MTVHFIGAGPGADDLITLRGHKLISTCPVCLYAGSLVPKAIVALAPPEARVIDTAPLHLDEIMKEIETAHEQNLDVARVHSGDSSLYGATAEQIRRLGAAGIPWSIVPGVTALSATAAALGQELTVPEICQSVIITRTAGKASAMPEGEDLSTLGKSGALLAIHLSVRNVGLIERELIPLYGAQCPAALAYRVSWPDELIIRTTLSQLRSEIRAHKITRTALILIGRALASQGIDSRLYSKDHLHILRPKTKEAPHS